MNWIGIEELLLIHARVIAETGGAQGVINAGALDSALRRPFTAFDGQQLFPGNLEKVATFMHSIVAFHPFADGNKRTALVAGDVVLRLNGLQLIASDAVEPFFWSIARGEQDVPQIAAWLHTHTEPSRSSFGDSK